MRRLLVRVTLVVSMLAAVFSLLLSAVTQTPWTLALARAGLAFAIVALIGTVTSLVLMRTALRRYYERRRSRSAAVGPHASR